MPRWYRGRRGGWPTLDGTFNRSLSPIGGRWLSLASLNKGKAWPSPAWVKLGKTCFCSCLNTFGLGAVSNDPAQQPFE
jgi:hypothetical protein